MKFKFKAIKAGGEKYEGEREAESRFALSEALKKEGATPVHVEEVAGHKVSSLKLPTFSRKINASDRIQFAKNLAVMIEAGLPITRSLSVMEKQARKEPLRKVLVDLNACIGRGEALSVAMEKHPEMFSRLFLSMVKAGEESGSLTASLRAIGNQLEKAHQLTKKIRGAMIYPIIIVCIMILITVLMLIFVVPTISGVFKEMDVQLPLMTRFIIGLSDFLQHQYLVVVLVGLALGVGAYYLKKNARVKRSWDGFVLRIPIIGNIVKETNAARTARTLTSLLTAGVDILIAIKISGDVVQNVFYKEVLKKAEVAVEKGNPISTVFLAEEKLYPAFVGEMASIGEETGRLSEMFSNVALYYEEGVEQKTKDLSTVVEPFLMVFIGIAVGFFAVSMLSPIYSLVDAI